jgi:hypothetical protein
VTYFLGLIVDGKGGFQPLYTHGMSAQEGLPIGWKVE